MSQEVAQTPATETPPPPAPASDTPPAQPPATPATEKKPEGEKPAEKPEGQGAPEGTEEETGTLLASREVGDFKLKLPETIKSDDPVIADIRAIGKELGLKAEGAQKLADLYLKHGETLQKTIHEQQNQAVAKQRKEWVAQAKADQDIGGEKFDASVKLARRALERFGSEELTDFLLAGAGDNPALLRAFVNVGRAMLDDTIAGTTVTAGQSTRTSEEELLAELYPTHQKKG